MIYALFSSLWREQNIESFWWAVSKVVQTTLSCFVKFLCIQTKDVPYCVCNFTFQWYLSIANTWSSRLCVLPTLLKKECLNSTMKFVKVSRRYYIVVAVYAKTKFDRGFKSPISMCFRAFMHGGRFINSRGVLLQIMSKGRLSCSILFFVFQQ